MPLFESSRKLGPVSWDDKNPVQRQRVEATTYRFWIFRITIKHRNKFTLYRT